MVNYCEFTFVFDTDTLFVSCHICYPLLGSNKDLLNEMHSILFYSSGNTKLSAKNYYVHHFNVKSKGNIGVINASKNLLSIVTARIEYSEFSVTENNAYSSSLTLAFC
jgi:hypothetical protein